jgi:hypothetical protein
MKYFKENEMINSFKKMVSAIYITWNIFHFVRIDFIAFHYFSGIYIIQHYIDYTITSIYSQLTINAIFINDERWRMSTKGVFTTF